MPVLKTNVSGLYFADGQLSFVGARDALIEFGSQLNTRVAITIEFAQVPLVSPYLSQASLVHVCVETEPGVSVTPDGDAVRVCGHPDAIAMLSHNIETFGRRPDFGDHIHEEYFPGHFYLRPESTPLVVQTA
jgi:hypothetical protein